MGCLATVEGAEGGNTETAVAYGKALVETIAEENIFLCMAIIIELERKYLRDKYTTTRQNSSKKLQLKAG
jgi:hypothetical protein